MVYISGRTVTRQVADTSPAVAVIEAFPAETAVTSSDSSDKDKPGNGNTSNDENKPGGGNVSNDGDKPGNGNDSNDGDMVLRGVLLQNSFQNLYPYCHTLLGWLEVL